MAGEPGAAQKLDPLDETAFDAGLVERLRILGYVD